MARRGQAINPFYPLLVVAGVAFAVTAFAYGIMALKAMSPAGTDAEHPLMAFLDAHGMLLMGVELGALAATSILAMATDRYWSRLGGNDRQAAMSPPEGRRSADDV